VNDSDKHASLPRYGFNKGRKKFYKSGQVITLCAPHQCILKFIFLSKTRWRFKNNLKKILGKKLWQGDHFPQKY
jgi:hypothetical protein